MDKKRDFRIDLLKTLAIFGVIVIHVCNYAQPVASVPWVSAVFWGTLTRASVPIFLMCSGALLLSPEKPLRLRRLFSHNILRILIALLVWAMFYKIYRLNAVHNLSPETVLQAFSEVLQGDQEFHFYYLRLILLMYLFLPVTRVLVRYANRQTLLYGLALWFLLGILYPTLQLFAACRPFLHLFSRWAISMPYASIGYSVLGYYLQRYAKGKPWMYLLLFAAGFAGTFGGTFGLSLQADALSDGLLEGMSVGVACMAVGIFGFVMQFCQQHPLRNTSGLVFLSKASFCIYLVHLYFLYKFYHWELTIDFAPYLISIPLLALLALLLSCLVYCFLRAVPGLRKWII